MGSSMGGLISLYALAEYPHIFGAAGCVSTHWPLLLPPEGQELGDADVDAVATAFEGYLKSALPRPGSHRIYFDHGTETLDRHYGRYQARIDRLLASRGWQQGVNWVSRNFPGDGHNEQAWRGRVDVPLRFLLATQGKADAR
jgi:pimeloyl-ACP methyl ester carboxylesterase